MAMDLLGRVRHGGDRAERASAQATEATDMTRDMVEPTEDKWGAERHPAWAMIGASRISHGGGGTHLFDSDITHQHTVTITLRPASRKRELGHDWLHGGRELYEVELSEAQWASFVSAMNSGTGVPCTLRYEQNVGAVADFPHAPRLAESIAETHAAADRAFAAIEERFADVEHALRSGTAKEKREALDHLKHTIHNAVPNVDFAGKQLIGHAEDVVQKSKADVEAFVNAKALQLGIQPSELRALEPGSETT